MRKSGILSLSPIGEPSPVAASDSLLRDAAPPDAPAVQGDDRHTLAPAEREQLERDIAEIERASAALRRAEPALQAWTQAPVRSIGKGGPVWLLIGVLWISTALVTLGAVVAIAVLVG